MWRTVCFLFLLAEATAPALSAQTTVNFDTNPSGGTVASGIDVSSLYAPEGVTFSVLPCPWTTYCFSGVGTTPVAAAAPCVGCPSSSFAASPPNVIGISAPSAGAPNPAISEQYGILKAAFSTPQTSVSIQVYSVCINLDGCLDNSNAPYLKAFSSVGTLLATSTTSSEVPAQYTLTVNATGIAYVEFSATFDPGTQTQQAGYFDNLMFSGEPPQPAITPYTQNITGAPLATALGPDGAVWFTEWQSGKIGRISMDGTVSEYTATSHPTGIATGPDGKIWYTDYQNDMVTAVDPVSSAVTCQKQVNGEPWGITAGPDGAVWFAELGASKIGRIDVDCQTYVESPLLQPGPKTAAQPYNITLGPDGNIWFTEQAGIASLTPSANPQQMVITQYGQDPQDPVLVFSGGAAPGPLGITAGPDGNIWFTEFNNDYIGNINPTTGKITQNAIPSGLLAVGIAPGPDGNLWFCASSTGQIGSISTSGGPPHLYSGSIAAGQYLTIGADGALWFAGSGSAMGRVEPVTAMPVVEAYPLTGTDPIPLSLTLGSDASMRYTWLAGIGRVTPTGAVSSIPPFPGNTPSSAVRANDGALWYTSETSTGVGQIIRLAPDGTSQPFTLPATSNNGPFRIVSGPDGALWFADIPPLNGSTGRVGRIDLKGNIVEYTLPAEASYVDSIASGPDGNLWFSVETPLGWVIGRIAIDGSLDQYGPLLVNGLPVVPISLTAGPDGNMWFLEYTPSGENPFGVWVQSISTSGAFGAPISVPGVTSTVQGMAVGPDGALWFSTGAGDGIGRLDLSTRQIAVYPASSNTALGLVDIARGPDGALWFADTAGTVASGNAMGRVGRISTPDAGNSQVTKVVTSYLSSQVTVDNVVCATPCTFNWNVGSRHTISASPSPGPLYQFYDWSDGGAQTHTITADWGPMIYVANFFNLKACDVTGNPTISVADAQLAIDQALGISIPTLDMNHDTTVNATDIEMIVNALIGNGCLGAP